MTDYFSQALEHEGAGELDGAARCYALYAFEELVASEYEYGSSMRSALIHLLESISADVRGGNRNRAVTHATMLEPLLRRLVEDAAVDALRGLAWEWIGDIHLLLGDESTTDYYENALALFEEIAVDDKRFWGGTPEFDNAYGAVKAFLEVQGVDYPPSYSLDFEDRVEAKIKHLISIES